MSDDDGKPPAAPMPVEAPMSARDDADLIRSGYDAFVKGDIPAVLEVFSSDIRWRISGRSGLAGEYRGHDAVLGFFGQLMERSGGSFHLELVDVLASEDHVVALTRETGDRAGRPSLDVAGVHIWRVVDGKAVEFSGIADDQYAEDAFWD
jgi:ketosteroid isomerase-like protein